MSLFTSVEVPVEGQRGIREQGRRELSYALSVSRNGAVAHA
jgi:hypothetical protein